MLKFVFFTDPHVTNRWPESRKDNFLEAILGKINWIVQLANDEHASILIGGDLFDVYNTNPEVSNMLIEVLRRAKYPIFSIIGNHDVYGHNYATYPKVIIGTLFKSGVLNLLTAKPLAITRNDVTVQLTGANYIPDIDKHKEVYQVKKEAGAHCAIHLVHGFLVRQNWPTLTHDQYTVLQQVNTEADITLTGHEHHGFGIEEFDGRLYSNPGALGRISASVTEMKRKPQVTLVKCFKDHYEALLLDVPHKPGTEVLSRERIEALKAQNEKLLAFKDQLRVEHLSCNVNDLFETLASRQEIPDNIRNKALEALTEYDSRHT